MQILESIPVFRTRTLPLVAVCVAKEAPAQTPTDDLPDINTADIYAFVGLNLWPDELAVLRQRCAQRLDVVAVEDGELSRLTMIHRAGAALWQAPSGGHYVIGTVK